jgi:hypothetical protein
MGYNRGLVTVHHLPTMYLQTRPHYFLLYFSCASQRSGLNMRRAVFIFYFFFLGGVRLTLSPLGTSATVGLLYQPRMIDDDYEAVGGMRIGRGNRSTRRKPAPVPLFPPQIPHDLTWDRTPGRRGGKPATNRLSYGTALYFTKNWRLSPRRGAFLSIVPNRENDRG